MSSLTGKVALITGGATGLGAAIASIFIREGARVIVGDIKPSAQAADPDSPDFVELDVTSPEAWEKAVSGIVAEHSRLDILVNNAGVISYHPILSTSYEEYKRQIDVNQNGVFLGLKAVLPTMIGAGAGAVVNIASIDGIVPVPGTAPYAASKHAVLGLTKAAAIETAALGIRVNAVCPGVMATAMALEADLSELGDVDLAAVIQKVPMQRVADPAEIAEVVAFLASDRASYCTGSYLAVDGGWIAGAPT